MCNSKARTRLCEKYLERSPAHELEGTIIDAETIGEFSDCVGLEQYKEIRPVTIGFLDHNKIEILYVTDQTDRAFQLLRSKLQSKLCDVDHPFYAFNAEFEMGVLYWFLGKMVMFDRDLMLQVTTHDGRTVRESKRYLVNDLHIPNFGDPFWDRGHEVPRAWKAFRKTGNWRFLSEIVRHNRACLLKEFAILKRRKRWRKANKPIISEAG